MLALQLSNLHWSYIVPAAFYREYNCFGRPSLHKRMLRPRARLQDTRLIFMYLQMLSLRGAPSHADRNTRYYLLWY